jgi:glycylpeptide N-tetradecanoyltransferase
MDEIYNLLTENYVEDDDNMFRFDYSREFLAWCARRVHAAPRVFMQRPPRDRALKPPGFLRQFHVGVRATTNNKLVGFITGIPAHMRVYQRCDRRRCTLSPGAS